MNELSFLLGSLEKVRLVEDGVDTGFGMGILWGFLSVKSFYESFFLISDYLLFPLFRVIWKALILLKVQVFLWTAVLSKVSTCDMMQKW